MLNETLMALSPEIRDAADLAVCVTEVCSHAIGGKWDASARLKRLN
jgi:hypothetical protein